jgi:hypothetical protein
MIAKKVWLILALALGGFLTGTYVSTGRETSALRALLLCPPAILMALSQADPRQSNFWLLVAPINACLYACVGLTVLALRK